MNNAFGTWDHVSLWRTKVHLNPRSAGRERLSGTTRAEGRSAPQEIKVYLRSALVVQYMLNERVYLIEEVKGEEYVVPLLLLHNPVELPLTAVLVLLCKGAMRLSIAQSPCHDPARPARILAPVGTVEPFLCARRTATAALRVRTAGLDPALHELPAVQLFHNHYFDK